MHKFSAGEVPRGGGRLPSKGRYGCAGPGIRFWEVKIPRALGFWQF